MSRHIAERVVRRLERFVVLGAEEKAALARVLADVRAYGQREDLAREGDPPEAVHVVLDGFACRYKILPDGRRQIVGFLVPGDMCGLRIALLKHMDYSVRALSALQAAVVPPGEATALIECFPNLARALWGLTLIEDSIMREWVLNVGYRTAFQRVAHLLCEVFCRLEAAGLTRGNQCQLPVTQMDLADTLALSSVHVNRTLMYMRRARLLELRGRTLVLLDRAGLHAAAGFDPSYLHLEADDPRTRREQPGLRSLA